jgi:endoglucanase
VPGVRAFIGEFGAPSSDMCLNAVNNMLSFVGENTDVFIGWAWWSAGPWWGDYFMSIEPDEAGDDKPQLTVLSRHLTV